MKKIISTPHAPKAIGPYSQAVEVNGILFISGQIPIDPETGKITAEIDLTGLLSSGMTKQKTDVDVLNGIAYDYDKKKIYVTGKLWPKIFEIEIISKKK